MQLVIVGIGLAVIATWTVCEIANALGMFEDPYSTEWYIEEERRGKNEFK